MMRAVDKRGCAYETWHLVIHPRDLERHEKFINAAILSIMSLCNQVINPLHNQPFSSNQAAALEATMRRENHRYLEVFGMSNCRSSMSSFNVEELKGREHVCIESSDNDPHKSYCFR